MQKKVKVTGKLFIFTAVLTYLCNEILNDKSKAIAIRDLRHGVLLINEKNFITLIKYLALGVQLEI